MTHGAGAQSSSSSLDGRKAGVAVKFKDDLELQELNHNPLEIKKILSNKIHHDSATNDQLNSQVIQIVSNSLYSVYSVRKDKFEQCFGQMSVQLFCS